MEDHNDYNKWVKPEIKSKNEATESYIQKFIEMVYSIFHLDADTKNHFYTPLINAIRYEEIRKEIIKKFEIVEIYKYDETILENKKKEIDERLAKKEYIGEKLEEKEQETLRNKLKGKVEEKLAVRMLLGLFNNICISILQQEYSLFDKYSENLSEISGFYDDKDKYKIHNELNAEKDKEFIDTNLIKSIMYIMWYMIEQCKIIDHQIDYDKVNSTLILINIDFKKRIDLKYPRIAIKTEIFDKEIIDLFTQAIVSIIEMTIIDHLYYYSEENIEKLIKCIEQINQLKDYINNKDLGLTTDGEYKEKKDFEDIVDMVKFKSTVLLEQFIIYYEGKDNEQPNDKETNRENFYKDHFFVIPGIKEDFETFLNENKIFNWKNENLNLITQKIRADKKNDAKIYDSNVDDRFLLDDATINKFNYEDICTFNKTSKESFDLFIKIRNIKENIDKEIELKTFENWKLIDTISDFCFKNDTPNEKNSKNPAAFKYFIEYLQIFLDFNLKKCLTDTSLFKDKRKDSIENAYNLYPKILKGYRIFVKNNENFNTGSLCFFPPYHECFYEIDRDKKTINNLEIIKEDIINNVRISNKDFFFFMSIGLKPLHIFYLDKRCIKYEEEYRSIRKMYRDLISQKNEKTISESQTQLYVQSCEFKATTFEFNRKINEISRNFITIVGILGAFIAFASISVGAIKVIDTPIKFVVVSLIYLLVFSSFAVLIRIKREDLTKKIISLISISFLGLLVAIILILCIFEDKLKCTTKEPDTKIENINNTVINKDSDSYNIQELENPN